MTRTRSPALQAPQTLDQALGLLGRYAFIDAEIAKLEADQQAAIAQIKVAADGALEPMRQELKSITLQLKPWWAVARDEITGGKRKSAELGGCQIGYRISPPRLAYEGDEEEAVARLNDHGWTTFIRVKYSLDKPAIVKFLDGDHGAQLASLGFQVRQREEFFVDRVPPKPAEPETVNEPAPEVVQ